VERSLELVQLALVEAERLKSPELSALLDSAIQAMTEDQDIAVPTAPVATSAPEVRTQRGGDGPW
jgi:hypothetical protein